MSKMSWPKRLDETSQKVLRSFKKAKFPYNVILRCPNGHVCHLGSVRPIPDRPSRCTRSFRGGEMCGWEMRHYRSIILEGEGCRT